MCVGLVCTSGAVAENAAPEWYSKGAYVFRVSTPDEADRSVAAELLAQVPYVLTP